VAFWAGFPRVGDFLRSYRCVSYSLLDTTRFSFVVGRRAKEELATDCDFRAGGAKEFWWKGKTGLFVRPSPHGMSAAMKRLAGIGRTRTFWGRNARRGCRSFQFGRMEGTIREFSKIGWPTKSIGRRVPKNLARCRNRLFSAVYCGSSGVPRLESCCLQNVAFGFRCHLGAPLAIWLVGVEGMSPPSCGWIVAILWVSMQEILLRRTSAQGR